MKQRLQKLYKHLLLDRSEAKQLMLEIGAGKFKAEEIASLLTVYNMRSISVDELSGFRDALRELALQLDFGDNNFIDIVGTGGDGKDTFNISTISAVVVAGAGYKVVKHGNYSSSSVCGSSNVLESLGYKFSSNQADLKQQLEEHHLCFLHAPLFHPAMKHVAGVRRTLGVRTIFNLLGPLLNPANPKFQVLGVSNKKIGRLYYRLKLQEENPFAVIYSSDGYDEISLTSSLWLANQSGIHDLSPADFGSEKLSAKDLEGGKTVEESAKIFLDILKSNSISNRLKVVCANAGLAIQTINPQKSLNECIEEAQEAIISGTAFNNFKKIVS